MRNRSASCRTQRALGLAGGLARRHAEADDHCQRRTLQRSIGLRVCLSAGPAVDDAAVQAYYKAHQAELKCEHASGLCVRVAILPPSVMALLASWGVKGAISPHTCEEA